MRLAQKSIQAVAVLVVIVALAVTLGADRSNRGGPGMRAASRSNTVSATEIIAFDDTVARLDTATGALYKFHGDFDNPSAKGEWHLHVAPVDGSSGYLEIQQVGIVPGAVFLVDVVTGKTWLLHRRGTGATWDAVDVYR